jgi:hypothetical protein
VSAAEDMARIAAALERIAAALEEPEAQERVLGPRRAPGERRVPDHSWVYFIQSGTDGPIKIGYTSHAPEQRRDMLQVGAPETLFQLHATPGERELEQLLHARLSAHRVRGEWFAPHEDVLAVIAKLPAGWPP